MQALNFNSTRKVRDIVTQSKQVVVQANRFAQNTGSDCTLLSAKIIYLLISQITNDTPLDAGGSICIDLSGREIWKAIGCAKNRSMDYLSELLVSVSKALFFSTTDYVTEMYPWFSSVTYDKKDPKGAVRFKFNPLLNRYLLSQRKNFTKYNLENIMALRSPYSVRIYNLLVSYAYEKEATISEDDLRFLLNLTHSTCGEDKYSALWRLKQRVLEPALEEINTKTDLRVKMNVTGSTQARMIHFEIARIIPHETFPESAAAELPS